jgi:hypothetical protein
LSIIISITIDDSGVVVDKVNTTIVISGAGEKVGDAVGMLLGRYEDE